MTVNIQRLRRSRKGLGLASAHSFRARSELSGRWRRKRYREVWFRARRILQDRLNRLLNHGEIQHHSTGFLD